MKPIQNEPCAGVQLVSRRIKDILFGTLTVSLISSCRKYVAFPVNRIEDFLPIRISFGGSDQLEAPTSHQLMPSLSHPFVGRLTKAASGAIEFAYDASWLDWENAIPISLSLPLRDGRYIGAPVFAVFDNLLPDFEPLRLRVAERVGAAGTDAYSLLSAIGRDCVGALQFLPDGEALVPGDEITGSPVTQDDIAAILANLARAPLGLDANIDRDFRISIAGAQEKTALLFRDGQWLRPHGTTPTTHILKPPIGRLPNGVDLSNSVENEFYCMKLMAAFGIPTARCEIQAFGDNQGTGCRALRPALESKGSRAPQLA